MSEVYTRDRATGDFDLIGPTGTDKTGNPGGIFHGFIQRTLDDPE